jgi:hypothetical protein
MLGTLLPSRRREHQADAHASYDPQLNESLPAWNQGQTPLAFDAPSATPSLAPATSQPASAAATPASSNNSSEPSLPSQTIGYIQSGDSYVFRCSNPACSNITFSRWPDLKRHIDTLHNVGDNRLWCTFPACERSGTVGRRRYSTTRKDKLTEHTRRMHG